MRFKTVYVVLIIIAILFISSFIYEEYKIIEFFDVTGEDGEYLRAILVTNAFKTSVLLLFPFIGIFIRNRVGWILVANYFYFLLSSTFFHLILYKFFLNEELDCNMILATIVLFAISILFLFILNKKQSSLEYFKTITEELIKLNIIAFVIGFSVALISVINNIWHHFETINII